MIEGKKSLPVNGRLQGKIILFYRLSITFLVVVAVPLLTAIR
jgi:hypothetical protein